MDKTFFTVGIGASAGGQKSLCEFFDHIEVESNVAFVVITHLMRERRSVLSQILSKHTALPVIRVEHNMEILPGHIYVMAENTMLEVSHGWLWVNSRDDATVNKAIDLFFNSLADEFHERAIGIVLSGNGEDGLEGAQWINHMGGNVIVQDPDSAEYKGMPLAIIHSDHPSAILEPAELAHEINYLCRVK